MLHASEQSNPAISFLVIGVETLRNTDKISLEINLEWVQVQINSLTSPGEMFYVFNFSHQIDSEKESLNISFKDLVLSFTTIFIHWQILLYAHTSGIKGFTILNGSRGHVCEKGCFRSG